MRRNLKNISHEEIIEIIEARRKYQREYHKKWRAENPDKVKAINARFYAKQAKKFKEENKED